MTTLSDEDELISVFDPWIIIPNDLQPSRSIQYNIGLSYNIIPGITSGIEGFYKIKGESYGWEFLFDVGINPVSLSLAYTLSWAYKEVEGWVYNPKYDTRHQFTSILEFNLGSGWITGLIWNYSTGLPFTHLIGYYDKYYLHNINSSGFDQANIEPFTIIGDRNLGRLPDYHRLDISLTKRFNISLTKWELTVSAINVYDRKNIYYFDRETGDVVNMLPFFISGIIKLKI
jgi:hypothetical protein